VKKLLLIGYRGYGDWLYAVPALPFLFKEYEVHIEMSFRGWEFFHDDPRFAGKTVFDVEDLYDQIRSGKPLNEMEIVYQRWDAVEKEVKPDKVVNLFRTLESKCLAERYQPEFKYSLEDRQKRFGKLDWYEPAFDACGIPFPDDLDTTGLYYKPESLNWAEGWKATHNGQFIIMIPVAGSGLQKSYPQMKELVYEILDKYENAVIYLVGGINNEQNWRHKRIYHVFGDMPYKQVVLMAKHANLVIGPETGLHVAAGMWGTPKIQLCNLSNVWQLNNKHKNDYSIQSQCECSPCHKMINSIFDCDKTVVHDFGMVSECTMMYDKELILENIETVYNKESITV